MGNIFPKCSTGTDDGGTIKLFWEIINSDRRLRLLCPHNADEKAYIYYQKNEEYGSEDITSAAP